MYKRMTEAFEDCTFGFAQNISHSNIQSSGFASGFPSKFAILGSHQYHQLAKEGPCLVPDDARGNTEAAE